ncbi:RusA family crossover junction endodeoxyribonuclease [Nocardioides sp. SOB77]|uniref:RusA family crossover junction endodeoxyribonuclease n=1 Tax=Nocardioides oceani TaxID=3058369 RepID=A0ABT8FHC6_9ACTN|nr:RusA family crossover junction endodeoxyribonuclease [Nocardioides oceani]MDN4173951.1 RusA family crossover junction endodeoxyribonuclease [Nocardioides oceani]
MTTTALPGRIGIRVYGTPITQGSKTANRFGGGVRDDNAKTLKPWRNHVEAVAKDTCRYHETITGPVRIWVRFTFDRPREHYGTGRNSEVIKERFLHAQPTYKKDIDKLQRAVFDALTAAAVWADDGLVVDVRARKFYAHGHELALDEAGVDIVIEEIA